MDTTKWGNLRKKLGLTLVHTTPVADAEFYRFKFNQQKWRFSTGKTDH